MSSLHFFDVTFVICTLVVSVGKCTLTVFLFHLLALSGVGRENERTKL